MLKKHALLLLLLVPLLAASATARADNPVPVASECLHDYGIFPDASPLPKSAWEKENAAEVTAQLVKKAEEGHLQAQRIVALHFARGYGVAQDLGTAAAWMKKAAEGYSNGSPDVIARYCMGTFYELGIGVPQDAALAYALYSKELYYPFAMLRAAAMLREGRGTAKDETAAVSLCHRALSSSLDHTHVPSLHSLWLGCMALKDKMSATQREEVDRKIAEKTGKLEARKKSNCPPLSKTRTLQLKTEPNNDGTQRPSNEPYTMYVPEAYLTDLHKQLPVGSGLIIHASYDTLAPSCSDAVDNSYAFTGEKELLNLYLKRGNATGKLIDYYTGKTNDASRWKLQENGFHPKYRHYFDVKSVKGVWRDMLVPRENELGVPYFIECRTGPHNILCKLHTDYKGKFHVEATFNERLLANLPEVYRKVNTLLDRFSTPVE